MIDEMFTQDKLQLQSFTGDPLHNLTELHTT